MCHCLANVQSGFLTNLWSTACCKPPNAVDSIGKALFRVHRLNPESSSYFKLFKT